MHFRAELRALLAALLPGGDAGQRRFMGLVVLASVPTALLGLGLKKAGVGQLGPVHVAGGLFLTALANYSTGWTRGGATELGPARAFAIGVVQGIAVLPGVSRSGSTIAAGMAMGLAPLVAARFSFLCSIPAVAGAALLTFKDLLEAPNPDLAAGPLAAGILVSFLVGWACLRFLMRQLEAGSLRGWAAYCFLLALGVLYATYSGGTP